MEKICKFCRKGDTFVLFRANNGDLETKKAGFFACTNCGFGFHGEIVKCKNCGVIYVNEHISQEKISTYYEIAEDPLYLLEQPAREITFTHYLKKLEKAFPRRGKLLDIGTNTGLFVYIALKNFWEAIGIEPNRWGVKYAKKNFGIDLVNKSFNRKSFKKDEFEVITMWDVIEHFTNPVEQIENVFWFLKPGGVFAFSTIDPESLFARLSGTNWAWYMEMHRVFLSRKTVKFYLNKAGFKKVVFKSHWRYLSLGYLATRLSAINGVLAKITLKVINFFGIEKIIVPYYANDLYDCYAYK